MSDPQLQTKEEIRKHYIHLRNQMTKKEVSRKSRLIRERVLSSPELKEAKMVHAYVSMSKHNEADTWALIRYLLESEKEVAVPKMRAQGELDHILLQSMDQLVENSWGIWEPETGKGVSADEPDLVLVPMVAGDKEKNRLGYGKGFYDRFLSRTDAVKMGQLFELQLSDIKIPVEPFDISLDILITEERRID